jgi:hypothetical protein
MLQRSCNTVVLKTGDFSGKRTASSDLIRRGRERRAVARKLGIRLWIKLRDQIDYHEFCRRGQRRQINGGACARMPETGYGAKPSPAE